MPLTSDYREIKDYEDIDHQVKTMFTFYCMFLGVNGIHDEKGAKEFYRRYRFYDALFGAVYSRNSAPEPVPVVITYPEVQRMIGIRTNVSQEAFSKWKNRMVKNFISEVEREIRS